MKKPPKTQRAADHLVDILVAQGTAHAFGVPGESFLPVLDAMHGREADIKFVTCRQEGGAAMSADAYGKLTGRPGICFVTRGPGATNASAGVHVAYQDSTPMILFIGQVSRGFKEREAFQEMDYRRVFGQMAKWVAEIDDASRIQEFIIRAFRTAMSGRPGPVVLSLPEDMLYDEVEIPIAAAYIEPPRFQPAPDELNALKRLIKEAKHPLVLVGGRGWTEMAKTSLQQFCEKQNLPVASSFRCQDIVDNNHPNYCGHFSVADTPYLSATLKQCDLLLAIGLRLGEITTAGYTLVESPVPQQKLVHVHPAGEELGRVFEPSLALVSDSESFCRSVAQWDSIERSDEHSVSKIHHQYLNYSHSDSVGNDLLSQCFGFMNDNLPNPAVVCNGAGNYAGWLHRFIRFGANVRQLAPTSGSMGYGLPAANAAASIEPDNEVFAFAGDGCFMMTCQELATACQYQLNLTLVVVNNARYGTIRAHQEREYPSRVSGTELLNPDFCAMAESFGAQSKRVESLDDFKQAMTDARNSKGVMLIEVMQERNILAPGKTLGD